MVVPTSQSSALQRSGRAGRVRSGKSYRLYTENAFHKLRPSTVPEMQRSNMASVVLQLKALGVDNILRFNFLSVCADIIIISCKRICVVQLNIIAVAIKTLHLLFLGMILIMPIFCC